MTQPARKSKHCTICRKVKPVTAFALRGQGKRRGVCSACHLRRRKDRNQGYADRVRSRVDRKIRETRKDVARTILADSRSSDKKKEREGNDLDLEFIRNQIANGCSYCGESELRMTLDRKDNSLAHTRSNVVPACIRCNYARGNMPFEAWLFLAPGMKLAKEAGAFGGWIGRVNPIRT